METRDRSRMALEEAAASCARLIDALRVCRAPDDVPAEVRVRLDQTSAVLAAHGGPGPHSQSAHGLDPHEFFAHHLLAAHEVMPFSPVIGRANPVSARMVFEALDGRIVGHGSIPVRFVGAPQTAHGGYFFDRRAIQPRPWARDDAGARRLWSASEDRVKEHL